MGRGGEMGTPPEPASGADDGVVTRVRAVVAAAAAAASAVSGVGLASNVHRAPRKAGGRIRSPYPEA